MASPGNPNTPGGGPFDMQNLFKPSTPPPPPPNSIAASNPNPQNFMGNVGNAVGNPGNFASTPFPPPSVSYPSPTAGAAGGGYTFSPQAPPYNYHQYPMYTPYSNPPPPQTLQEFGPPQRSLSYPTPPLQPQAHSAPSPLHPNFQNPANIMNQNNHGARLMALLSAPPSTLEVAQQAAMPILPTSSSVSDSALTQNASNLPSGPGLVVSHQGTVLRMLSSKLPKGRHLIGDRLVYDIDVRLPGEVQPQLEVTPITKYGSDPGLILGRQIAVNKSYICYGLKLGTIRVLNINTALRSLLKGLTQRVTDMAFFAEDVHILASASVDGRVYIWKITEGPDEEDKPQLTGRVVIAIKITGEAENAHPRVCWHCHKQEVLVVGIGRHILKIDTTKVGKGEKFSAEEPIKCPIEKLLNGVQLVGTHDGEVTDLSMCQWMTTRLVSASADGTIKIWEDRKTRPIAVFRPHDGQPVNSVTFLAAPHRPDHIILITGGSMNREVKIWVSASEEGWLLPSDAESWRCTQTLELKSTEAQAEEAFFNQVIALSQAGLLLLANAKRNAIYAVHLEYGPNPAATCMDYIAEFTVTLPILSFTGTSELLPHGEQVVQVYCVQTQAIQQYALDLSQCLPPPMENVIYDKSESSTLDASNGKGLVEVDHISIKPAEVAVSNLTPKTSTNDSSLESPSAVRFSIGSASSHLLGPQEFVSSSTETSLVPMPDIASSSDISSVPSPSLPLSPRLSKTLSGFRSPLSNFEHGPSIGEHSLEPRIVEYSVDRQMDVISKNISDVTSLDRDSRSDGNKQSQDDSMALGQQTKFKHPTHLVTPSEILMASASEASNSNDPKNDIELNIQDVAISNDARNIEVEVKVVGETSLSQSNDLEAQQERQMHASETKEKSFCSQASDLGIEIVRESRALLPETYVHEAQQVSEARDIEYYAEPSTVEEVHDSANDASRRVLDSSAPVSAQEPTSNRKGKKQKGKSAQGSGSSSAIPSAFNSTDSSNGPVISSSTPVEATFPQLFSMQEMLNQLVSLQKDMQKQIAEMVAVPVTKEGKRLEAALGRSMEKACKANADALWARFQEESAKQEKAARDRMQQLTNMISNSLNKDLPAVIDKTVKRELSSVVQSVARTVTPVIDKAISTSIVENFQKGVGDKAVNQLEKSVSSKLEATVSRQIQTQFQTSGKQALQETLKSSLEASVIPAIEMSCRVMFEQVDATFQKGMLEHTAAAQHQLEASHSPLAIALRDAINSASSITQTLNSEILDGQRKLLALAVAGANSKAATNSLVGQLSNGPLSALHEKLEVPLDPTKELSRLIGERKYEEAFTGALHRSDVSIVSWLCAQVDLPGILSMAPLPLSQGVLLSLLQQLACDINNEPPRKLTWMREILSVINPTDAMVAYGAVHVRPIFDHVYQTLNHHRNLPTTSTAELSNIRLIMHVINSMLMSIK